MLMIQITSPIARRSSRMLSHGGKTNNIKNCYRLSSSNGNNVRSRFLNESSKNSRPRFVGSDLKSSLHHNRRQRSVMFSKQTLADKIIKTKSRSKSTRVSFSVSHSNTNIHNNTTFSMESFVRALQKFLRSELLKVRSLKFPRWISPRPHSYNLSELFGHGSFVLVATAYAMDDYLMLRVTAVAGSTSMLLFTYFHPHGRVLWLPFQWNLMFIALNLYRIGSSLLESYLAEFMDEDMLRLKQKHLTLMEKTDFCKLLKICTLETHDVNQTIVRQGEMNHYLRIIVDGDVDVFRDGIKTYTMTNGNFIAEAGMHAGLEIVGGVSSNCTIKPCPYSNNNNHKVTCLRWDRTKLVELCRNDKTLYRSLQFALSWDIVRKLKSQRKFLITHEVNDPELWTIKRTEQSDSRYESILQNILDHHGHLDNHRNEIAKYRSIHQIDDEHHNRALDRCGWTLEEFALGRKIHNNEEEKKNDEHKGNTTTTDDRFWAKDASTFLV